MSAGDYILLIVVFYFPPFSSHLKSPTCCLRSLRWNRYLRHLSRHLCIVCSSSELDGGLFIQRMLSGFYCCWRWILPTPAWYTCLAQEQTPVSEITGARHRLWTSTNAGSVWKASVGARWRYVRMRDVSVWVRVELVFVAVRKYHLICSLNELLCWSHSWRKTWTLSGGKKSIERRQNCQMAVWRTQFSWTSSP